ncbi:Ig-like domain-containing protein [Dactylosporangium matsuzakiense]|uniref:Ig-like domain-containing protein n=1 Tax=Dactylosporangium matsuzakiense TaxID=53360 RepID=UPI0021C45029|nr:Ig-like domain-containing protein [Dactylosporangium matsuzakiense]UWZ43951.1 L,D-transpeptidase family protein [Dactylosporangium matsuzakiense]
MRSRWTTLLVVSALALTACSNSDTSWKSPGGGTGGSGGPAADAKKIRISAPADGAKDVTTGLDLVFDAPATAEVTLQDATGAAVTGTVVQQQSTRPPSAGPSASAAPVDGVHWVPDKQLKWATEYTATVKSDGATGEVKFTTMAKPSNFVRVTSQIGDNQVVGVGMPMILSFANDIPKDARAGVQRRLFMSSDPPQEGVWNWFSAKEVHFRPKEYWQAGTKLKLRAALGGVSMGGKTYAEKDLTVDATVGKRLIMDVDNTTKKMTITEDGVVIKTMPVSLGKPSNPSDSGNFIVMVKNEWEWFDSSTYGVPVDSPDGYRTKVQYPQRITWSGQYIHAAPWSVDDQGRRNVSHGCVNISLELAQWLYTVTHLGDPVIVKNTEERVKYGDGWTDWELPWDQYVKGSAL